MLVAYGQISGRRASVAVAAAAAAAVAMIQLATDI
jgi:hypothetical protein